MRLLTTCAWCTFNYYLLCYVYIGYVIEKCPEKGLSLFWTAVNSIPINVTTVTVPNLVEDSEWEFRVVAVNDAGPGKPSRSTGLHRVRNPVCKLDIHSFRKLI